MERKTTESYSLVLTAFRTLCEERNIQVVKVVSDFEAALRLAVQAILPNADVVGCHFHFSRAVFMRFKKFGLVRNQNEQKTLAVKMAMCIPLLPHQHFDEAIVIIRGNLIQQ